MSLSGYIRGTHSTLLSVTKKMYIQNPLFQNFINKKIRVSFTLNFITLYCITRSFTFDEIYIYTIKNMIFTPF